MGKLRKYVNVYSDGGFLESIRNFRKGAQQWAESIRESVRQAKNGNRAQSTEPKFVVSQYPESPNNAGMERGPYSPIKHKSDDLLRANAKVTYVNNAKRNWNAPVKKAYHNVANSLGPSMMLQQKVRRTRQVFTQMRGNCLKKL